jgi:PcfJ-like protein
MATKINVAEDRYHISGLGIKSFDAYISWCKKNGFSTAINKNKSQLKAELAFVNKGKADHYLSLSNKLMTIKKAVEAIRTGPLVIYDHTIKTISQIYHDEVHPEFLYIDKGMFLDIILFFDKRTKILELKASHRDNTPIAVLILARLLTKKEHWINSWDTWKPSTYNASKQLSLFIRHLLAKYDVPLFFDHVWYKENEQQHDWFIHVAQGQNIMTAPGFLEQFPCTKKMAHYFMQAPNSYTFPMAWRFGQVASLGGNTRLTEAMLSTKLAQGTNLENDFCLSVIKFFIANPMLDLLQIGPIVDYIWSQKYENQRIFAGRGVVEHRGPAQPNFSMAGRTVETLLAQVDRWHRQLGKEKKGGDQQWEHSGYKDFEFQEGSNESQNVKFWRITELLSSNELISEGRAMHHCVASYAGSCASGKSMIWSLTRQDHTGRFRHLTIEVTGKGIHQIRGLNNRSATEKEMQILKRWAGAEGLSVETYGRW